MKRKLLAAALVALVSLSNAAMTFAYQEEGELDARLEGFPGRVVMEGSGTALTYLLLVALAGLCVGVMFKSAKRTHLD